MMMVEPTMLAEDQRIWGLKPICGLVAILVKSPPATKKQGVMIPKMTATNFGISGFV
jgi:hypothetical protein